jgi:hypothetical protein
MMPIDPRNQKMNIENANELEIPSWILKLNNLKANIGNVEKEHYFNQQLLTALKNEEAVLELYLKNINYIAKLEKDIQFLEERYSKIMKSKIGKLIKFYWKLKRWVVRKLRG